MPVGRKRPDPTGIDLFSTDAAGESGLRLLGKRWPPHDRFPVNRPEAHVRSVVWNDLLASERPLIVAGYSSIAQLVDLAAQWSQPHPGGQVRVLLGTEPHPTLRQDFTSATAGFTEEAYRYWLEEQGISLRLSAKVVQSLALIDEDRLVARFIQGRERLHAKIYLGLDASTVGSSNFTQAGLSDQIEVNARFAAAEDPQRHAELVTVAENLWEAGSPWTDELRVMLTDLLQVVTWQQALARACADLLEGFWADRYLTAGGGETGSLWPSQRAGIAQALWITSQVGSVLVADATGSGKTRMGAHLIRAVHDRLWDTGRVRPAATVAVCPPAVEPIWAREAIACGLTLFTVSHGKLSLTGSEETRTQRAAVSQAQTLAVDEAHNFLNGDSNRTRQLRGARADHVLLFTATPISRGAGDLLALVTLLGADNFDDATLDVLARLSHGRSEVIPAAVVDRVRAEISRFTVRRTKTTLNALVDRDPDAYTDPLTGRVARYPVHRSRAYPTGETGQDAAIASRIRQLAGELTGIGLLEATIAVPVSLRSDYTDQRWLDFRLGSIRGLAAHHVLDAMRSSRAALVEHLAGSAAAVERFVLDPGFKQKGTGEQITRLDQRAVSGPPAVELECKIPPWLTEPTAWAAACQADADRYRAILTLAGDLSPAREEAKAKRIADLVTAAGGHERVLVFDRHLITLAAMATHLAARGIDVVTATGETPRAKNRVQKLFAREATGRAVALCSDALNEGLNLQGASALVHLDFPTTLRVAEQRVGRVDRMDSPHDQIEVWWPRDGDAFATHNHERLVERAAESTRLLGSNLDLPDLGGRVDGPVVDVDEVMAQADAAGAERWDGLHDALDPVRQLVTGETALITAADYDDVRSTHRRVLARVSPVRADRPWVFLAVAGSADGAPRWYYLDGPDLAITTGFERVCQHLRTQLTDTPASHPLDADALTLLDRALIAASRHEFDDLPQRLQRARQQMAEVLAAWTVAARRSGDQHTVGVLERLAPLADAFDVPVDPYVVADRWLRLVSPVLETDRRAHPRRAFTRLSDITEALIEHPLSIDAITKQFAGLPPLRPIDGRVTACILGVTDYT
jgi:hypothetical protein